MSDSLEGNSEITNNDNQKIIEPIFVNPRTAYRSKYANQLVYSSIFFFAISLFMLASMAWELIFPNNYNQQILSQSINHLISTEQLAPQRLITIYMTIYTRPLLIVVSAITCIFIGYLLLNQAGAIGRETISEQDQKLLTMLSEKDDKGVGVDKFIKLTSLTGITGFFTKIGITGLPLATISLTLIFGLLALLNIGTDASAKFFDFANLALGAFLGSYVQKQEPKSNIVDANNKPSETGN